MRALALILVFVCASFASNTEPNPNQKTMQTTPVSLGYILLYVKDVPTSIAFYEKAFSLKRRFLHESNGYGEMETGSTRLAFVSLDAVKTVLQKEPITTTPDSKPLAFEIALVTADVAGLYAQAVKAGGTAFAEPKQKPWGQTVGYVRDPDGHLVELCSPLP